MASSSADLVFLTTKEAAHILKLSHKTLEKLRCRGGGPAYRKMGKKCFYTPADLAEWVDKNRRLSTSDPGPNQPPAAA